jgi:CheY-like chemotaxis protein
MSFINQTVSSIGILKGVQVLVVDNDRDSRYLYETLLKGCGANVITVASVQEAIDVFAWLLPNILICEMRFLGESVSTLTTKLSDLEARGETHIPAIAITTWITDSLVQILEAGFEGFLLKPIDLDQLVSDDQRPRSF